MVLTLKVRLIPDMSQFNRDLKRGVTGVGGNGRKPSGKGAEVQVTGFGKMLGLLGIVAGVIKSIDFIVGPIMKLLGATLALLFVPLIPILKPLLEKWSAWLGKFSTKSNVLRDFLGASEEEQKSMAKKKIGELWEDFKSSWKRAWNNTVADFQDDWKKFSNLLDNVIKPALKSAFESVINAIIGIINKLPGINVPSVGGGDGGGAVPSPSRGLNMSTPSGPEFATPPVIVNVNDPVVQTPHDANMLADRVANKVIGIFKSGLTRTLPLLR